MLIRSELWSCLTKARRDDGVPPTLRHAVMLGMGLGRYIGEKNIPAIAPTRSIFLVSQQYLSLWNSEVNQMEAYANIAAH